MRVGINSHTSFKSIVLSDNVDKVIKTLPEEEQGEINQAVNSHKEKYWDLEVSNLQNKDKEFFYYFTKKQSGLFRRPKRIYCSGVTPYKREGNVVYVSGCAAYGDIDDNEYDILKFPTVERAIEVENEHQEYLKLYKSPNWPRGIDTFRYNVKMLEAMEESYEYMHKIGFPKPPKPSVDVEPFAPVVRVENEEGRSVRNPDDQIETEKRRVQNTISTKRAIGQNGRITFDNVGGQDAVIDELKKKVLFPIKYPQAFKNRMLSHGIVLYGPPGTGKTLVALALSNEADANFIKINASSLTCPLHGQSEANWREVFAKARKTQPSIIFIDEFDTVAQKRGHNATNNYDDTILNTILTEMSDVEKHGDNVFVIAATNRFEELDEAALRKGRFGTHLEMTAPQNIEGTRDIFEIHTADKNISEDADTDKIIKSLFEMNATGSDIAAAVNDALENTFIRKGIYEKMENGSFRNSDISNIVITNEDFEKSLDNLRDERARNTYKG